VCNFCRLHYGNIIWLLWQRPLPNRKISSRFIICTQGTLIWRKDCENRSSRSGDIRQNTPVFWPCRTRRSQMSSVNSGVTGHNFTKFSHYSSSRIKWSVWTTSVSGTPTFVTPHTKEYLTPKFLITKLVMIRIFYF